MFGNELVSSFQEGGLRDGGGVLLLQEINEFPHRFLLMLCERANNFNQGLGRHITLV